jgi:hypothetical protein
MTSKKTLTTDEWVHQLNELCREMDEWAMSMHPSAWHEALAADREKWLALAKAEVYDPPEQLQLLLFEEEKNEQEKKANQ